MRLRCLSSSPSSWNSDAQGDCRRDFIDLHVRDLAELSNKPRLGHRLYLQRVHSAPESFERPFSDAGQNKDATGINNELRPRFPYDPVSRPGGAIPWCHPAL